MRKIWGAGLALAAMAAAGPAGAVSIGGCDGWMANPVFIAEPWGQNTRTFYNDQVRVALMDTNGEPVCCSVHLLVLMPNKDDELGGRSCHLIHNTGELGFSAVDFKTLKTGYDAKKGLLLTFRYSTMREDGSGSDTHTAGLRINIARNTIAPE